MIDITAPKVLVPTILFILLNPGVLLALPPNSSLFTQVLFHGLVFSLLFWAIINFVFKFTTTPSDLIVPFLYFITLTPGVLFRIPPSQGIVPIIVHSFVFSIVWASTRGLFPQFY